MVAACGRNLDHITPADVTTQLGLSVNRQLSFPLPRVAVKMFIYNEFVLVARKSD